MVNIKVLMIGPAPPQLGGMEAFIGELLKTDLPKKVNLFLFDISKPKLTGRHSTREVVGYDAIFKRNIGLTLFSYLYSFKFLFQYIYRLVQFRPHIVHVHTASYTSFWEKIIYIFIAKIAGCKVILHSHGGYFIKFYKKSAGFAKALIRKTLKSCDLIFVLSDSWLVFYESIVPNIPIIIAPNGIHLEPFSKNHKSKSNKPSFLFIGRVGKPKGVYELLSATAKIVKRGMDCCVLIMGAGELDVVKEFSHKLNITKNVEILGPKYGNDKYEYYSKAWCFVLPSRAEGMPITILEAFAAGLPVIATKVGSIPSVVQEGVNGYLFDKQNVEQLADCMTRIINEGELREKMGKNNTNAAKEKYDIKDSATIIYSNYKRLLSFD